MTLSLLYPEPLASITPAESAELAARLQVLAKSGLPLEGGLRALAEEVRSGRLAGVLCCLAERLEDGEPLEAAIAAADCRLPVVLRGLIVAGIHSGRLPEVLEQFTAMDCRRQELRRRIAMTFAYPALLLGIIALMLILFGTFVTAEFGKIFRDFGTPLPAITELYIKYSAVAGWTVFALAAAAVLVPLAAAFLRLGSWLGRVLSFIPVLGPIVRHERYVQFARLMATLLEAQVPLPHALNLTAMAMQGTMLAGQCAATSAAVGVGIPVDEALFNAGFLDSLTCFVSWGQSNNSLADAFTAAAECFDARTSSQTALLNLIVLPLAYLFIITFVGFSVLALFMPFLSLITTLSG
jgi:type II secretory pathway component PulF